MVCNYLKLALLLVLASPAFGAIANVAASKTLCNQTVASAGTACTLTASTTAGNTVVVKLAYKTATRTLGSAATPWGVKGSAAAAKFFLYGQIANGSSEAVAIYICTNCAAITTVTPGFSGTTLYVLTVDEYSGVGSVGISAQATATSATPAITLTTSDSNNWIVMGAAALGNAGIPTANTGNLLNANRTGTTSSHVAGASCDNTVASPGSVTCSVTHTSGTWAAVGVELRSVAAPTSYQWPNCDSSHPCIIHEMSTKTDATTESNNGFKFRVQPTLANNAIGIVVTHLDTNSISSLTDDKSNSYASPVVTTDETSDQTKSEFFVVCGAATGTSEHTLTMTNGVLGGEILNFHYFEIANVPTSSCTDGSSAANALTTNPIQPGSITTTANGDLIYNFGMTSYPFPTSEHPQGPVTPGGATTAMVVNNTVSKLAASVQYQTSSGAINPALYVNDEFHRKWNSLAVAFKTSAGTGTLPSGINVTHITHFTDGVTGDVLSVFPSTGNLLIFASSHADDSYAFTALRDNNGNTYTRPTHNALDGQIFYSCSATPGTDLSYSWTQANTASHMVMLDVAGAATGGSTACYDTTNSTSGSQAVAGTDITGAPTITPTTSNGLVFMTMPFGTGPASSSFTSGVVYVSTWATGMLDTSNWDSGDAYGYYYNPNTSAISFDWHMANASPTNWNAQAVAFKAPAAGGATVPLCTMMLMGVGPC